MKPKNVGQEVIKLLLSGKTNKEISEHLQLSPSSVTHHSKKIGLSNGHGKRTDWPEIVEYYNNGASFEDCCEKFNVSLGALWKAGKRGLLEVRKSGGLLLSFNEILEKINKNGAGKRGNKKRYILRKAILRENLIPYICAICGINEWNNAPLTLRLDHKDGDGRHNELENLRFLCPNCDSQQETYCYRNRGRYDAAG